MVTVALLGAVDVDCDVFSITTYFQLSLLTSFQFSDGGPYVRVAHLSLEMRPSLRTTNSQGYRCLERFQIDGLVGRLADRHPPMESPPIDFVGRLYEGRVPLQALDHRVHVFS